MDLAPHLGGERRVDEPLALHGPLALEARGDDHRAEVPRAAAGARMPRVQVALVDDDDRIRVELALEIQGRAGSLAKGDAGAPEGGHWQRIAYAWPEVVIGGGTPNIQRNILAERVLGLPKD